MSWFRTHRVLGLAVLAGLAAGVAVLAGVLVGAALDDRSGGTAASRTDASAAQDAAIPVEHRKKAQNARVRRIRLGQSLSMTRLRPLDSRHATAAKKGSAAQKSTPAGKAELRRPQAKSWSLVAAPANAKVSHEPGAPTFTPDVHGTYVFERRTPSGGQTLGAAAQRLMLRVDPVGPLVCVNTRVSRDGGAPFTKVGDTELPRSDANAILQVVVLDRATAGFANDAPNNSTFTADDFTTYATFLSKLTSEHLVLVNGTVSASNLKQVWGPLAALGAADVAVPAEDMEFSFIGIPGIAKGSAWQTLAPARVPAGPSSSCADDVTGRPAGNLSGWLTLDTTGVNYTYVSPDFVDFDTEASADQGAHAIEVGNKTYSVPTGQWNGFHAVVLDRRVMCPEATPTSECDPGPPLLNQGFGPENGGLDAMNEALKPWANNADALLFLAPFTGTNGAMAGVVPTTDLITTLRAYGAGPLAPGRSLGNGVKYALVGGGMNTGLPAGSAKPIVAESFTGFGDGTGVGKQTGQIAGTLVRDRQNRFGPRQPSLIGADVATLGEIVYGPTSSWPEEGKPAQVTAFLYLSQELGYRVDQLHPQGVRGQYPAWTSAGSVPDPDTRLPASLCADDRPGYVDAAACATVLHELRNEFMEVKFVDNFLDSLQKAYIETEASNENVDIINKVEDDMRKMLTPPPAKTSLALTLVHFVLSIASVIPEVGEVFEVAGAELDLAESLAADDDGSSTDPMQAIYDTGDDLLAATDAAFAKAVAHLDSYQPIIVSDYAKLTVVGHRAATDKFNDGTDLPKPPWVITNDVLSSARTGLEHALKQWLYPPLVDAGFPVWRITIPSSNGWNNAARTPINYRCTGGAGNTHPFYAESANGWIQLGNGHGLYTLALGGTRYDAEDLQSYGHHAAVPDAPLLAEVFGALPDHVGLDRTWYFEHYFKRQLDGGNPLAIDCWSKD